MKANPITQSNTKDLCDPKRKTHNLKNEAMEIVINNNKTKKMQVSLQSKKSNPYNKKIQHDNIDYSAMR